ncbi:MAG: multidrug effflux MFS transporter [Rhodospirillaceae bacterium]|nr:multidrug effflux MFS transporter [Rhodospirillaceae bacterium]
MNGERLLKFILMLTISASSLAVQIFLPSLPSVQGHFNVTAAEVQLAVSIPLLCVAAGTLFWGVLSDRYGRKPMLMAGLAIFLVGSVMSIFAPNIAALVGGRIIQAFGSAAGVVISRAIVRDVYGRERAAAVLASLIAVMVLAPMMAPIIGGALVDLIGWYGNFIFMAVFVAATLALTAVGLPETNRAPIALPGVLSLVAGYGRLLRSGDFRAYALQSAFMIAVFYVFLSAAPYVVLTVMGRTATEYGLCFILSTIGYLGGNIATNRLTERWGIDRMIRLSLVIGFASNFGVLGVVAAGWWNPIALFIPLIGTGLANGMALPNSNAGAVSVYPELAGTASGLLSFIQLGLAAVFAQAAGSIQNGTPYPLAVFMCVAIVGAMVAFYGPKGLRARPSGSAA